MKTNNTFNKIFSALILLVCTITMLMGSSHREAPLISNDPLADNVDLYAFRSPDNPDMITIIATYVPLQLPHGGPNYYTFGENVRYEIHIDNDASVPGDEILYRFSFNIVNEDPTTFFNIRLGKQNQKASYTLERSTDGGMTFQTIIENGVVPPNNIGSRSISGGAGLNTSYEALMQNAITNASTGETVFAGPTDDPFFVDLGGIFDLGDAPRQNGEPQDGVACYNVSAIAIQVPISTLLKSGAPDQPGNILDPDYVIGVWASASRPAIQTLSKDSGPSYSGDWIQVSRLGMPLTNEAVIPIGQKDFWNSISPYDEITETSLDEYFYNPELALYMDDSQFGGAVPAFSALRIQSASLGAFDFRNGASGLFGLKGNAALEGTALDDDVFGTLLLPADGKPRSVDLWPAFHTGVPNVRPYQLATGKNGDPLAAGKPFVNNFLPNGGDMLRLNMAVPPTPRDDANFSSLGLVQAAAIGLTVAPFNQTADLEFIPNMDGFPNGRRLEDDVTRIELQAVSGVVLAAIGLWYDDFDPNNSASPVTQDLLNVLTYTTGVESNDLPFQSSFPYLAIPHSGTGPCSGELVFPDQEPVEDADVKLFVSSNTSSRIGVFSYKDSGESSSSSFEVEASDADGIHYDEENDIIYQLNRSDNRIDVYTDVIDNLGSGNSPVFTSNSSSDFVNGREIAVSNNKLVVAQDASASNGNVNQFVIYSIDNTIVTLDRIITTDINLWGIDFAGDDLIAVSDNTSDIAVYTNFLGSTASSLSPDRVITVDELVRTHGLCYDATNDVMALTDVGSGAVADDGAYILVDNWTAASMDDAISSNEQLRVAGPNSLLGNPVDIAYDHQTGQIFIAERANAGGRYLVFSRPSASGDQAPETNEFFEGASAIFLSDCRPEVNQAESIVYYDLNACTSFLNNGSNTDYSEFTPAYPNTLDCSEIQASNVFRQNPQVHTHSCTPGVNGSEAMCVSAMDACDYNAGSVRSVIFELVVEPQGGESVVIEELTFFEKAPERFDWIQGPSGMNNYPTLYGIRVLKNGTEIFREEDVATNRDWTLQSYRFEDDSFMTNTNAVFRFELLGYCPVGNNAQVQAWDLDEISVNGRCESNNKIAIQGSAITMTGEKLENLNVRLESQQENYPKSVLTDKDGFFSFENNAMGMNYSLDVQLDGDPLEGISTLDLIMIQRHILGIERLDTEAKLIAADVNFSDNITALDLIELRRVILGISKNFKDGLNWNFADASHPMFYNDPLISNNVLEINALNTDNNLRELIAIKTGDVSYSSKLDNSAESISKRNSAGKFVMMANNQALNSGQQYSIDFYTKDAVELNGFQYTLKVEDGEMIEILPGAIGLSSQNYSIQANGNIHFSWNSVETFDLAAGELLFTMVINSGKNQDASDMLSISNNGLQAESYMGEELKIKAIDLSFENRSGGFSQNALLANVPNPFSEQTSIRFELAENSAVRISIYDLNGRLLKNYYGNYSSGLNTLDINASDFSKGSGIFMIKLQTAGFTDTALISVLK